MPASADILHHKRCSLALPDAIDAMTAREAVVTLESGATGALRRGANDLGVVCLHPWGPLGGSRDDPHVLTVANTCKFGAREVDLLRTVTTYIYPIKLSLMKI